MSCRTGKVCYPSRKAATRALAILRATGAAIGRMAGYCCPYCQAWHLGHTKRRR